MRFFCLQILLLCLFTAGPSLTAISGWICVAHGDCSEGAGHLVAGNAQLGSCKASACSGDLHLNWLHPISRSSVLRKTEMSLCDCSFTIGFVFVGVNYVKMQIVQKQAYHLRLLVLLGRAQIVVIY